MAVVARRDFLKRAAAVGGGLAIAGPLQAFAARKVAGAQVAGEGYGDLVDMGLLSLPPGFRFKVISQEGDIMSDGNPTPGIFDGMAAFPAPGGSTILIRNHENRRRSGEIPVVVPAELRYDSNPSYNGGNTKLIVSSGREVVRTFAILGGTSTNCAGGQMPWGSWVTSEEVFDAGNRSHGYNFEIDAYAEGPVAARPILSAGRFVHEAVVWKDGVLYETEDRGVDAAFYRYVPDQNIRRPGDLAASTGELHALRIPSLPNVNTKFGFPVGQAFPVDWVTIAEPNPSSDGPPDSTRAQAQAQGAAAFDRIEGCWVGNERIYFDCTDAGAAGFGQIWEYDPAAETITLLYESPGADSLKNPDNLVVAPTGHLLLCEDSDAPQYVRGLTPEGEIYDFCKANAYDSEFAGACFDARGRTLFVNQQGNRETAGSPGKAPGITYAIWGAWERVLRG